ncbi:MAG: methyltransferase, TIGR04325 family [Bacteroidota bacterium]
MKVSMFDNLLLPILRTVYSRIRGGTTFKGNYRTWEDALRETSGYDTESIVDKVAAAQLKVVRGEAAYERDSVVFDEIEYSWPLLASLLWIAARSNGSLRVEDFGGSLGSSYYQNKKFISQLRDLKWGIVEQARFVHRGKKFFENEHLKFFETIEHCEAAIRPNAVLCSSSLSYIPNPYEVLQVILNGTIQFVIVDATLFTDEDEDRLCVQTVDPRIYKASYPCWLMSRRKFLNFMSERFSVIEEFDAHGGAQVSVGGVVGAFQGFLLERISP